MTVVFSDTFTDTDGTTLASHTPTVGASYTVIDFTVLNAFTAEINTNRLNAITPGYSSFYRWKLNPASAYAANHTIAFNWGANIGANGRGDFRFQTRFQSGGERYEFRLVYDHTVSTTAVTAEIRYITAGGTVTVLATTTFSPSAYANEPFVCTVNGTALSMSRNGSGLLSTTDSTIASAGDVNLRVDVSSFANAARLDDLTITNTGSGPTPAQRARYRKLCKLTK
jgi:hypothetical protein